MENEDFIAGHLKPTDWAQRKAELTDCGNGELWADTFERYLMQRLRLRYLDPIKTLQSELTYQGEGFSIATIQCSLIEFLAALRAGKNYRFGNALREFEYRNSRQLYVDFLKEVEPFSSWFDNENLAADFYSNVRCALVHEARTKNGWRILASGQCGIDAGRKIVWRDQLQEAIESYLQFYGTELVAKTNIQEAFIRKFDHLCTD